MNKCTVCGAVFDDSAMFCSVCGAKLVNGESDAAEIMASEPIAEITEAVSEPESVPSLSVDYVDEATVSEVIETEEEDTPVDGTEASEEIGGRGFVEDYIFETPTDSAPAFGVYQPKKYRSGKWWKVLLAVTAGMLAVVMSFVTIITVYVPMLFPTEYSKGEINGNVYVNEFADLYFELGTLWKNAPKSEYKNRDDVSGENSECGLFVTRDATKLIVTYFGGASGSNGAEILKSTPQYKDEKAIEKGFLDDIIRSRGDLDDYSVSVDVKSIGNIEEIEIADSDYAMLSVECDIILNGKTYKIYHSVCARVIGDHAVVIQVSSDSERAVESALMSFKPVPSNYRLNNFNYEELPKDDAGEF